MKVFLSIVFLSILSQQTFATEGTAKGWCTQGCIISSSINNCPFLGGPTGGLRDCAENDAINSCYNSGGKPSGDAKASRPNCNTVHTSAAITKSCISYGEVKCVY